MHQFNEEGKFDSEFKKEDLSKNKFFFIFKQAKFNFNNRQRKE